MNHNEMDWSKKAVLVTGGSGFLGSRVVSILKERGVKNIVVPTSKEYDLRLKDNCNKVTKNIDIVFHLAAKVGGIGFNNENPGELFYDNLIMGTNIMEESRQNNVEKMIALGTICSYPKFTPIPFSENSIWEGYPEETNAPYGLAKKMLLVQSDAYRKQYQFNSVVVFPTNLYGPNDNFDDNSSHVIPAIIKKIMFAKKSKKPSVSLWGDGTATRDFLYVDDAAEGIILTAEKYSESVPLNLGTGIEISIKELAEKLLKITNANLEIIWETDKPNGQPRRCVDNQKAKNEIEFEPKISMDEGLKRTVEWYEAKFST
jgi:GDP-L-fucose synthase